MILATAAVVTLSRGTGPEKWLQEMSLRLLGTIKLININDGAAMT